MPLERKKWEDIPERDRRNNYYGEQEFSEFEDEMQQLAADLKKTTSAEEFSQWLADNGRRWLPD